MASVALMILKVAYLSKYFIYMPKHQIFLDIELPTPLSLSLSLSLSLFHKLGDKFSSI